MRPPCLPLLIALLVFGVTHARPARAAPADYSPDNRGWQGTSQLFTAAEELGFSISMRSKLEWSRITTKQILVFLYPTTPIPLRKLVRFLKGGGRVILADDFGSSAPLLEQLGIKRFRVTGNRVARLHDENPSLPIATPDAPHPLNDGVQELVTNHPAAFRSDLPAIFTFEPKQGAVVIAATLGKGRVILISDPSVLINRMLQFKGNQLFARKLLQYFGRPGEDEFVVYTQAFVEAGKPRPPVELSLPKPKGLSAILADANELLKEFNSYLLERMWILPLATLLAGMLLVLAVWLLPMMRPIYDAHWTRPGEGPPPSRYTRDLTPYLGVQRRRSLLERLLGRNPGESDRGARGANYLFPAVVLRDVLDTELADELGTAAPLTTMDEHALARYIRQRAGDRAAAEVLTLVQLTRRLPRREQVAPQTLAPRWSFRELQRLHDAGNRLLYALRRNQPRADSRPPEAGSTLLSTIPPREK